MGLYVTLFLLLIAFATFRALQEKKQREERRRRMLQNLRTALDA
jgi:hypothetical protein